MWRAGIREEAVQREFGKSGWGATAGDRARVGCARRQWTKRGKEDLIKLLWAGKVIPFVQYFKGLQ